MIRHEIKIDGELLNFDFKAVNNILNKLTAVKAKLNISL